MLFDRDGWVSARAFRAHEPLFRGTSTRTFKYRSANSQLVPCIAVG